MTSEPKQDRSRLTRERLLTATIDCLAEQGWAASTVSQIVARAGISRGAAQHHYATREELILAALDAMYDRLAVRVAGLRADAAERSASTEVSFAQVSGVVEELVDLYQGREFRAALVVWSVAVFDESLHSLIVPRERRFARVVHALGAHLLGIDSGDVHGQQILQATLDFARGLALASLLTDDTKRRAVVVQAWSQQLAAALSN